MRHSLIVLGISLLCLLSSMPAFTEVTLQQQGNYYTLENEYVRLRVNTAKGAVIDQYLVKASGTQLCPEGCFLLGDHFWQQLWPGEFLNRPYESRIITQTPEMVTLEVSRISTGWRTRMRKTS